MSGVRSSATLACSPSTALQQHGYRCLGTSSSFARGDWKSRSFIRLHSTSSLQPSSKPNLIHHSICTSKKSTVYSRINHRTRSRIRASSDSAESYPEPTPDVEEIPTSSSRPLQAKLLSIFQQSWREAPIWIKLPLSCYSLVALLLLVTRGVGPIKDLLPLWFLALPLSIYLVWQSMAAAKFLYAAARASVPFSKTALSKASQFQRYAQSGSLMENLLEVSGNARRDFARKQEMIIGNVKGKQEAWTEYVRSGKLVEDVKVEFQRRAAEQAGSVYDGVLTAYESVVDWWSPNRRRLQRLFAKLF